MDDLIPSLARVFVYISIVLMFDFEKVLKPLVPCISLTRVGFLGSVPFQ